MAAIMISVDDITMKTCLAIIEESIYGQDIAKPRFDAYNAGFHCIPPSLLHYTPSMALCNTAFTTSMWIMFD
jgi:hypothetical protein